MNTFIHKDEIKKCCLCDKYIDINRITCCIRGNRLYFHPRCHKKIKPLLNTLSRACSVLLD